MKRKTTATIIWSVVGVIAVVGTVMFLALGS